MNQYLVMIVIAALGVVAFINADSSNRAKFGKIETELLLPGPTITNGVIDINEAEEVTFKCRKEMTPARAAEKMLQVVPRKTDEKR